MRCHRSIGAAILVLALPGVSCRDTPTDVAPPSASMPSAPTDGSAKYAFEIHRAGEPEKTSRGTFLVGAVRVALREGNSEVQIIPVELDDPLSEWVHYGLRKEDINFDGHTDIAVRQLGGAKWGTYYWWVYDGETERFGTTSLTSELKALHCNTCSMDPEQKHIVITRFHGAEHREYRYALVDGHVNLVQSKVLSGRD